MLSPAARKAGKPGKKLIAKKPAAPRRRAGPAPDVPALLEGLERLYPDADCELRYESPLQLLVAVILSAQCTDERVNQVTPALFQRYPDAAALAAAEPAELEALVRPTGFFRMKAKHLREAARLLVRDHGGQVPRTMDALLKLPGVARKTANVVLGTAYDIPSGVVVDTHVRRLAFRLGMTRHAEPEKIEQDLMKAWPEDRWIAAAHQLILHGRRVCAARAPRCEACALRALCPRLGVS
jgi:endonuclease III